MANNNYIPIAHIDPGTNQSAYEFTGLDTQGDGWKELIIRGKVQTSDGAFSVFMTAQVNDVTTNSYTRTRFAMHDNTNTALSYDSSQSAMLAAYMGGSYLGDWPVVFELKITGCGSSDRITVFQGRYGFGGHAAKGYMGTGWSGGAYQSTNNITKIKLMTNFDAASSVTLYGRK